MIFNKLAVLALFSATQAAPLTYTGSGIEVKVTGNGNVPKYTFSSTEEGSTEYKVMFQKIDETEAGNNVAGSNLSLPSQGWTFVDNMDDAETPNFTITTTDSDRFTKLEFVNRIVEDTVKFDVVLDGYNWVSENADTVNLYWKFEAKCGDDGEEDDSAEDGTDEDNGTTTRRRHLRKLQDGEEVEADTELCLDGCNDEKVCFGVVDTAVTDDGSTVDVSISNDDGMIQISYNKYDGDLLHDPSFRIDEETSRRCFFCMGK